MNWIAIEAVAVICSAIATAVMAGMTYWTIRNTRKQHKDEYRPILSFAPRGAVNPCRLEDMFLVDSALAGRPDRHYFVYGIMNNVGRGPALNITLTVRFLGIDGYGVKTEIAPIGAGDRFDFSEHPMEILVIFRDGFNDADFQLGPGGSWEILIEYEDVFGQRFHTIHTKNPQHPWTVIGCGSAPKGRDPRLVANEMQAVACADATNKPISLSGL